MFWQALFAPWAGLRLLLSQRTLWRLALWPVILTLLGLVVGVTWGLNSLYHAIQVWLQPWWPTGVWSSVAKTVLGAGLLVIAPGVFSFLFLPVSGLIAIPFLDILATATGVILQLPPATGQLNSPWRDMLGLLGLKLLVLGLSWPLLFVPGVGWVLFGIIMALLTAVDCWDVALACRRKNLPAKLTYFRQHWPALLGFALPLLFLIWIPVVQLLLLPAATVGAVQLMTLLARTSKPAPLDVPLAPLAESDP